MFNIDFVFSVFSYERNGALPHDARTHQARKIPQRIVRNAIQWFILGKIYLFVREMCRYKLKKKKNKNLSILFCIRTYIW